MKWSKLLLSPDAPQGGSGGEVFDDSNGGQTPSQGDQPSGGQTPPAGTPPAGTPPASTPPASPSSPSLTAADMEAILSKVIPAAQVKPDAPKELTTEEFNRAFNVFLPTKEHIAALRKAIADGEEGEAAGLQLLQQIAHGASKQAATIAAYQMQQLRDEIVKQFTPALDYVRVQNQKQLRDDFFAGNKDLLPYEPLVAEIASRLQATGYNGSVQDAFKLVAEQAHAVIAKLPQAQTPAGNGKQSPQPSRMSTLSGGGQGGAGNAPQAPAKSGAMAIFDN